MTSEKMVHMANQIAGFFASYPHQEAVEGVTDHLKKFWERRMQKHLLEYIEQGGAGLHALVLEAAQRLN